LTPAATPSAAPRPSRWRQQRARLSAWIRYLTQKRQATGRKTPALLQQFHHSDATPIHPLWQYLPEHQRSRRTLDGLRRRRLWAWLKQKRQRIALVLILYVLLWCIPLLIGEHLMTVVALLPLLLVPPVGYLVYWLVWKEFHA